METKGNEVALLLHRGCAGSEPTRARRFRNNLSRNRAAAVGLLGLLVFACVAGVRWGVQRSYRLRKGQESSDDAANKSEPRTMADLVLPEGYPFEEYQVETEDGYLLGLYRIPSGKSPGPDGTKPVVLLQHGVLDSSATWVLNGAERSLGFILADAGCDVWLSNSRGNTFGKEHRTLGMDTKEFWDFSYDEMVKYDIPAVIHAVLSVAQADKLVFVGHSQGALTGFLSFAKDKVLARKVSLAVMMAPVMYVTHMTSPILRFLALKKAPQWMYDALGWKEFMPRGSKAMSSLLSDLCGKFPGACNNIMMAMSGYNPDNLDGSRWDYFSEFTPAGTSAKNMAHWTQGVNNPNERLCQAYDYGTKCTAFLWWFERPCNQRIYGSMEPMVYDLTGYSVQTAVLWGGRDMLADDADVKLLLESLPSDSIIYRRFVKDYEHLDFTWGIDAHTRIYPEVINLFKEHLH